MSKKKILVLTNVTYDLFSMRKEVIQSLLENGYEVTIAGILGAATDKFIEMGCTMIHSPLDRRGKNPFKEILLIIHYINLVSKVKPDVVLTYTIKPNIYGGIACSVLGKPYISNITGLGSAMANNGIMQKVTVRICRFALRRCSCLFVQNKDNWNFLTDNKIKPKKYRLIPGSGVNLTQHSFEVYPDDDHTKFLFIGRIMKEKGINELLEAINTIKKKYENAVFQMIGLFEEEYQEIITEYQQKGLLEYYGRQDNVHEYIKNCHAVILPSYHEGMANVLLEAASCGRPVIASNIPGCRETFEEKVSGVGFEVKNSEDLTKKIIQFIELPNETRKQMGIAGRRKMEMEFNREIVVNAYLEEIKETIG